MEIELGTVWGKAEYDSPNARGAGQRHLVARIATGCRRWYNRQWPERDPPRPVGATHHASVTPSDDAQHVRHVEPREGILVPFPGTASRAGSPRSCRVARR